MKIDPNAPKEHRVACPDCPDGYIWNELGQTDKECPTCRGRAYVVEAIAALNAEPKP